VTKIKAAITAGIRPMAMIYHEQPTAKWTRYDFLLIEAYQVLQDETCPQCGQPVWLCRSDSPDINIKVRRSTCNVTAVMEKQRDKDQKNKSRQLKPGESYYPVIEPIFEDSELPSRADYYRSQMQPG